ncbi:MAG: hypothetical protein AB7Q42_09680 [Acidimicrobiia bacterium]
MSPDFRSQRGESPEGKGIARRAWDTYAAAANRRLKPVLSPVVDPLLDPAAKAIARDWVGDLLGFWVLWHLHGGFEGLQELGYHRATVYRKISRFRQIFGVHPDEFEMPGVTIDPAAYWAAPGSPKIRNPDS